MRAICNVTYSNIDTRTCEQIQNHIQYEMCNWATAIGHDFNECDHFANGIIAYTSPFCEYI